MDKINNSAIISISAINHINTVTPLTRKQQVDQNI